MPAPQKVEDKKGDPIEVGEEVWTRFRGGKHQGEVEAVVLSEKELEEAGDLGVSVKNPPKVIFTDQHGHKVSHNPTTLQHTQRPQ